MAAPAVVTYDTWQCLAGTYDGAALRLYCNGVEVATQALPAPAPIDRTTRANTDTSAPRNR